MEVMVRPVMVSFVDGDGGAREVSLRRAMPSLPRAGRMLRKAWGRTTWRIEARGRGRGAGGLGLAAVDDWRPARKISAM